MLSRLWLMVPRQLCLKTFQEICFACPTYGSYNFDCTDISPAIKVLFVADNIEIDYSAYTNSTILMIMEWNKVTYYSCENRSDYFSVTLLNSYPIGRPLRKGVLSLTNDDNDFKINFIFQVCLEGYCDRWQYSNRLECLSDHLDNFTFGFNSIVSPICIQNITRVILRSSNVTKIDLSYFFLHAYNIVDLTLEFENLKSFECHVFRTLPLLRVVRLWCRHCKFTESSLLCIFRSNPKMVMIDFNDHLIWNFCDSNDPNGLQDSTYRNDVILTSNFDTKVNFTIVISMLIFSTYFMAIYYLYYIHKRISVTNVCIDEIVGNDSDDWEDTRYV